MLEKCVLGMFGRTHETPLNEPNLTHDEAYNLVESAILEDKRNYNRVRNTNTRYLRHKYGTDLVNTVLHTINNRHSRGLCYTKLNGNSKNFVNSV